LEPALTRVSRAVHRVLLIARVAEHKWMTNLLRPVVEDYATRLADEPEIATMLKEAGKYEARKKGVEPLPDSKRASRGRSSRRSSPESPRRSGAGGGCRVARKSARAMSRPGVRRGLSQTRGFQAFAMARPRLEPRTP
jgi:hypothetical protein